MSDSLFYKGLIQFPKPSVNISQRSSQERNTIRILLLGNSIRATAIPISLAPQFMSSWRITSLSKWLITLVRKSPFSGLSRLQMGLSENSVPLNPMVNDHYAY